MSESEIKSICAKKVQIIKHNIVHDYNAKLMLVGNCVRAQVYII